LKSDFAVRRKVCNLPERCETATLAAALRPLTKVIKKAKFKVNGRFQNKLKELKLTIIVFAFDFNNFLKKNYLGFPLFFTVARLEN